RAIEAEIALPAARVGARALDGDAAHGEARAREVDRARARVDPVELDVHVEVAAQARARDRHRAAGDRDVEAAAGLAGRGRETDVAREAGGPAADADLAAGWEQGLEHARVRELGPLADEPGVDAIEVEIAEVDPPAPIALGHARTPERRRGPSDR